MPGELELDVPAIGCASADSGAAACVRAVGAYFGVDVEFCPAFDDLRESSADLGAVTSRIISCLEGVGLVVQPMPPDVEEVCAVLQNGFPVIAAVGIGAGDVDVGFAVVCGYRVDAMLVLDPHCGVLAMPFDVFVDGVRNGGADSVFCVASMPKGTSSQVSVQVDGRRTSGSPSVNRQLRLDIENAVISAQQGQSGNVSVAGLPLTMQPPSSQQINSRLANLHGMTVLLGPEPENPFVAIFNDKRLDGSFVGHTLAVGFPDVRSAKQSYFEQEPASRVHDDAPVVMTASQLQQWLKTGSGDVDGGWWSIPQTAAETSRLNDASALAQYYADHWNALSDMGDSIVEREFQSAADELQDSGWFVDRTGDGQWRALHADNLPDARGSLSDAVDKSLAGLREWRSVAKELRERNVPFQGPSGRWFIVDASSGKVKPYKNPNAAAAAAKTRDPNEPPASHRRVGKGGITLTDKDGRSEFYRGGRWVKREQYHNLSDAEKQRLFESSQIAARNRAARGDVDVAALHNRLAKHARTLSAGEQRQAEKQFRALHNYHGDLTLHRLHEMAAEQERLLEKAKPQPGDMLDRQIRSNLARLQAMIGMAEGKGVSGKVPEHLRAPRTSDLTEGGNGQPLGGGSGGSAGGRLRAGQPLGDAATAADATHVPADDGGTGSGRRTGGLSASDGEPNAGLSRDDAAARDASASGAGAGDAATDGSAGRAGGAGRDGEERVAAESRVGQDISAGDDAATAGEKTPQQQIKESPPTVELPTDASAGNFHYDGSEFLPHGPKAKFRANLEAIRALKNMEAEGRASPTAAEQEAMSKYVGWGQLSQLFKDRNFAREIAGEMANLRGLLTDEEERSATASTKNAHFTHPDVVKAHWQMAAKLGYEGGRFLETSAGIGYYLGMMPPELAGRTHSSAVELDLLTGRMLEALYPAANVKVTGFENFSSPHNFYDLVASNVPFGDYSVADKTYDKLNPKIHDYFFLKSLDLAKPGGLVMHVTSTGTLDKLDPKIRQVMADKCELVAAVRFPGGTHKENAGTEVVTDLLILRKKDANVPTADPNVTPPEAEPKKPLFSGVTVDSLGRLYHWLNGKRVPAPDWTATGTIPDPDGGEDIRVNRYFIDNPHMILGRLDRSGSMYRADSVNVAKTEDFQERLQRVIDDLPSGVMRYAAAPTAPFANDNAPEPGLTRRSGLTVRDGKLYVNDNGTLVEEKANADTLARVEGQLEIRDKVREIFATALGGQDTAELRRNLNDLYDAYTNEYGPLHDKKNAKATATDPDAPVLLSLENYNSQTKTATKADIFHKDTVRPNLPITKAGSVAEALVASLHTRGIVDVSHMAKLTGLPPATIAQQLVAEGLAFNDPNSGWQISALYLSGNVRAKLVEAQAAVAIDPSYQANVDALLRVQPEDVDVTKVEVSLGAFWVPPADIADFAAYLLGTDASDFDVSYVPATGRWEFGYSRRGKRLRDGAAATTVWGTKDAPFAKLMDWALKKRAAVVRGEDEEGKTVILSRESADANAKIQEMQEAFRDWLWQDAGRRERLHRFYNDNVNNIRNTVFDGSHLTFPGMNPAVTLRDHQRNFIWQVILMGKGLAAHEVGTGKTYTMIAAAMELRRMGLANKPAICCKKANIDAITAAARYLYPGARILSTSGKFKAKDRKETVAQMATGDYDLVILTHDHIDLLSMKPEVEMDFLNDEKNALYAALTRRQQEGPPKGDFTVKELENRLSNLEVAITRAQNKDKDDAVYFEETGIDHLFVDESQDYKNLPVYSAMGSVKGIPNSRSDRATNMQMRTRWLLENNGGRGVVFATGTPVANAITELYTLQRYLQPEELERMGIETFDAWASNFGNLVTRNEFTETGEYKPVTRFSEYTNVPELMQHVYQFMNVERCDGMSTARNFDSKEEAHAYAASLLNRAADEVTEEHLNRRQITVTPNNEGGWSVSSPTIVRPHRIDKGMAAPKTEALGHYMDLLRDRAKNLKYAKQEGSTDNMLNICTDGRKAAIDMRMVNDEASDDPHSKVNLMIDNVLSIAKANPGKTQLIFSDVGVNPGKDSKFCLYDDVIDKLVAGGIPRDRIANFSKMTDKQKEQAQADLRSGKMRIGIGGTETLGTGVNVQDELMALHHLDVPHRPSDIEQRDGRGWRQGNKNDDISIFRYVTEGSVDQTFWQRIANKMHGIQQVVQPLDKMTGARKIVEEDTEEMSPDEFIALASGDPRVLRKVNLEKEVRDLRSAKNRHDRQQADLVRQHRNAKNAVPVLESVLHGRQADAATLDAHPDFSLTVGYDVYDNRAEAGKALDARIVSLSSDKYAAYGSYTVGEYRGLRLVYRARKLYLEGNGERYPVGPTLPSIEAIARSQKHRVADAEKDVAAKKADADKLSQQIGKAFRQEGDLNRKSKELADLEKELQTPVEQQTGTVSGERGNFRRGAQGGEESESPAAEDVSHVGKEPVIAGAEIGTLTKKMYDRAGDPSLRQEDFDDLRRHLDTLDRRELDRHAKEIRLHLTSKMSNRERAAAIANAVVGRHAILSEEKRTRTGRLYARAGSPDLSKTDFDDLRRHLGTLDRRELDHHAEEIGLHLPPRMSNRERAVAIANTVAGRHVMLLSQSEEKARQAERRKLTTGDLHRKVIDDPSGSSAEGTAAPRSLPLSPPAKPAATKETASIPSDISAKDLYERAATEPAAGVGAAKRLLDRAGSSDLHDEDFSALRRDLSKQSREELDRQAKEIGLHLSPEMMKNAVAGVIARTVAERHERAKKVAANPIAADISAKDLYDRAGDGIVNTDHVEALRQRLYSQSKDDLLRQAAEIGLRLHAAASKKKIADAIADRVEERRSVNQRASFIDSGASRKQLASLAPPASRPELTGPESDAVAEYTYLNYHKINRALRGDGEWTPELKRQSKLLESAMAKVKTFRSPVDVTSGRNVPPHKLREFIGKLEDAERSNKPYSYDGFLSTSVGDEVPNNFRDCSVLFKIQANRGLDAAPYTRFDTPKVDESEMILPHKAKFQVNDIEQDANGRYVVTMMQL